MNLIEQKESILILELPNPTAPPLPSTPGKQEILDSPSVSSVAQRSNKKRKMSHVDRLDEQRNQAPESSQGRGKQ